MKYLKVSFFTIILSTTLVFIALLSSSSLTKKIFDYATAPYNITYETINGSLLSGISLKNFNYNDQFLAEDIFINPSILSLLWLEFYIYDLSIFGISLDNSLLQNKDNEQTTKTNIPFSLYIKSFQGSILDYSYEQYHINKLLINGESLYYDFRNKTKVNANMKLDSNIFVGEANLKLNNNKYHINSKIEPNIEFLNSLDSIKVNQLNPILININGDLDSLSFDINTNSVNLNYENFPILLKNIVSKGSYKFDSKNLDITTFQTTADLDGIASNISLTTNINNFDINSVRFDINATTSIPKNKTPYLQKDILINSNLKGNLYDVLLHITSSQIELDIDNNHLDIQNTSLDGNIIIKEDFKKIQLNSNFATNIKNDISNLHIKGQNNQLEIDMLKNLINGQYHLLINSDYGDITSKISFDSTLDSLDNIKIDSKSTITNLKYENYELSKIEPLEIDLVLNKSNLDTKVSSKIFNIEAQSDDLKEFIFTTSLQKINPNDFIDLPSILDISSVQGKIYGTYNKVFDISSQISLDNANFSSKFLGDFENFVSTIHNNAFTITATKESDKLDMKAQITSLDSFGKELSKLSKIQPIKLNGMLDIKAQFKDNETLFDITSKNINYDTIIINNIYLQGLVQKDIIIFNKINFDISDIFDINLQKSFVLAKQGYFKPNSYESLFDFSDLVVQSSKLKDALNIKINTKELFLAYPKYGSGFVTSNLLLTIEHEKYFLKGDLFLKNFTAIYQAPAMSIDTDSDIIIISNQTQQKQKDLFLEDISLELSIFADNFNYSVKNINLKASTVLVLKKDYNHNIKVYGSLHDVSGKVVELGKEYILKDSNVYFRGIEPVDPILDIKALHKLQDIDINIHASGTLSNPRIYLSSNPTMSQRDILSYLIFGTRFASQRDTNQSKSQQASLFLLNELSKDYAKEIGLDMLYFEFDPQTQYIQTLIGKNISKKSMIILKDKADSGQIILIRELSKLWNIELGFEGHTQSVDLTYKKRY